MFGYSKEAGGADLYGDLEAARSRRLMNSNNDNINIHTWQLQYCLSYLQAIHNNIWHLIDSYTNDNSNSNANNDKDTNSESHSTNTSKTDTNDVNNSVTFGWLARRSGV